MSWQSCQLGEVITLKRGHDLPENRRLAGDVPIVSSSGVTGHHNVAKAAPPGVVTGRYGTLGEVYYLEESYWPLNTALYVIDFKGNHPRFAAYFLKNALRDYRSDKAAVPGIDRNVLHTLKVRVPDHSTQERIVTTLSAYDRLMDNNRRRMELLERAAQELYKEWFVQFHFPGHEHVQIKDGVPTGWTRAPLTDLAVDVSYGFTASASDQPIGPKFLRITDIVNDRLDWSTVPFCAVPESRIEKFAMREGDVVVARTGATTGYAKRIGHLREPAVFASYLVRFRFDDTYDPFMAGVFMESDAYKAFVRSQIGGAAQPNANAKILGSAKVLVPPRTVQRNFRAFVEPLFSQIDILVAQSIQLRRARDHLLPKVMSGEIAV